MQVKQVVTSQVVTLSSHSNLPGEPKLSDYFVFYHNLKNNKDKSINQKRYDRGIYGNLFVDSPDCFHVEVCLG